jgi:hypothetical protein
MGTTCEWLSTAVGVSAQWSPVAYAAAHAARTSHSTTASREADTSHTVLRCCASHRPTAQPANLRRRLSATHRRGKCHCPPPPAAHLSGTACLARDLSWAWTASDSRDVMRRACGRSVQGERKRRVGAWVGVRQLLCQCSQRTMQLLPSLSVAEGCGESGRSSGNVPRRPRDRHQRPTARRSW